jgi:DNA-nicking Smr family endonuclease
MAGDREDSSPEVASPSEDEQTWTPESVIVFHFSDTLDLHGFSPSDVPELVASFLDDAVRNGRQHLRIIHGKGSGVLRQRVRAILGRDPRVIAFGDLPEFQGGRGATWVDLKPLEEPSNGEASS